MNMDEQFVFSIMEKFNASSITELDLDDGTARLLLRKKQTATTAGNALPIPQAGKAMTEKSIRKDSEEKIPSPIVGTFYLSPSPDAPPFVNPGSKVKAGQTLCILEAMKMMNHLEAEYDCEILEIHANSGELVEYGQNLFTVKKL